MPPPIGVAAGAMPAASRPPITPFAPAIPADCGCCTEEAGCAVCCAAASVELPSDASVALVLLPFDRARAPATAAPPPASAPPRAAAPAPKPLEEAAGACGMAAPADEAPPPAGACAAGC